MSDHLQRSFESMSMGRAQNGGHSGSALPMRSSTGSLNASSAFANTYSDESGAPSFGINANGTGDPQSASARFERIFNPGFHAAGPSSHASDAFTGHTSPYKQYQALPFDAYSNGTGNNGPFGGYGPPYQSHHSSMGQQSMNMPSIFAGNASMSMHQPKSNSSRQGLPLQWGSGSEDTPLAGSSPTHAFVSPQASFFGAPPGSAGFASESPVTHSANVQLADDDVIPTAIVVKNIPFSVKREQLLQIIEELHIPMPYAFNYHFDQGVFRGLAFANFRSGEEADAVVAALNGFDVAGRKLRVEYKKVLQAGEKERIEKEKAIKRMQSMQMEKERVRRQTVSTGLGEDWASHFGSMGPPAPPAAVSSTQQGSNRPPGLDLEVARYGSVSGASEGSRAESYGGMPADMSKVSYDAHADLAADAASELSGRREDLDLNDSATLEIYSRVLLFKDDRMRDELSFSRNLSPAERRIVEMVSRKLNLYHYSSGDGEDRFITVTKSEVSAPYRPLRNSTSIIGRNNRGDSSASSSSGFHLGSGSSQSAQSARNSLRMKKSAPDMKRPRDRSDETASYAHAYAMGLAGHAGNALSNGQNYSSNSYQTGAGLSRKSNGNLREGYTSSMTRRSNPTISTSGGLHNLFHSGSAYDVPPVPALPSHAMSDNASLLRAAHTPSPTPIGAERSGPASVAAVNGSNNGTTTAQQQVLRQPAGPGGAQSSFATRGRGALAPSDAITEHGSQTSNGAAPDSSDTHNAPTTEPLGA